MTSKKIGLIRKYEVTRVDGKPVDWCFVLQDTDPLAPVGLVAYAAIAWEAGYTRLHRDLIEKIQELQAMPGALSFDDECDRCGHARGCHYITFDAKVLGCSSPDEETDEGVEMCGCMGFIPRPEAA